MTWTRWAAANLVSWNEPISFWGLEAPLISWLVSFVLVGVLLWSVSELALTTNRIRRRVRAAAKLVSAIAIKHSRRGTEGASVATRDELGNVFVTLRHDGLGLAWANLSQHLIRETLPDGRDVFYADRDPAEFFDRERTLGDEIDLRFYSALPGVITGVGLLVTFVAILIALMHLRVTDNQVEGINLLIEGLSGKFLSSIVALLAATILIVAEKRLLYGVDRALRRLAKAVSSAIPRMTSTHLLARVNHSLAEQSDAFRSFNSNFANKVKSSFSEGVTPVIDRMVKAVEELNQLMRAAESTKQQSMSTEIERVLQDLQGSLRTSLQEMGQRFTESLSGTSMTQFERVADSLGGTSRLLENMNSQFQSTQSALNELVRFARSSTEEQMALGKSQVEELTTVLRQLMLQLNDSADSSLTKISTVLSGVVQDLSTKVSDLGIQLASTVTDASGKATSAATAVVDQVTNWSAQNARHMTDVLSRHAHQLDRISDLRSELESAGARFSATIQQSSALLQELRTLTTNSSNAAQRVESAAQQLRQAESGLEQLSKVAATQVEHLTNASRTQQETWSRIQNSMTTYQQAFERVEKSAGVLLSDIAKHLETYTDTTRKHMEGIVAISDNHMADAVKRLGTSIGELDEQLQNLTEIFERKSSTPMVGARR